VIGALLREIISAEIEKARIVDIADKFRETIGDSFQDAFRRKS